MTERGRKELEPSARFAVLVKRSDLPVPPAHAARSFFGGLPKLPAGLDWPRAEVGSDDVENATVALSFIAQIDLGELSRFGTTPLPRAGTLYFFCSSAFVGVGDPPCRVLYHPGNADALAERRPPSDLMALAGNGGDYRVKWLDPATDLQSKVEFKYPITFLPFRDFESGGELLVKSLCDALGPGEADEADLLMHRRMEDYAQDAAWPFNWLLITHVARAALSSLRQDLDPPSYRQPPDDATQATLRSLETTAIHWLERGERSAPLETIAENVSSAFRAWWLDLAQKYQTMGRQLSTSPYQPTRDLGAAINHTIRCVAAGDPRAVARLPRSYLANLERQNHWKTPTADQGERRFFSTSIHQMLGYGSSWQDAPEAHRDDVLLLQVQGDFAFFNWHANTGCVLHFWIDRDALSKRDFAAVTATFECD